MKHVLMNDIVARKIFKKSSVSKELTSRLVSEIIGANYDEIYNNIELISEELAFSSLTVDSRADVMLKNYTMYVDIEICYSKGSTRQVQTDSYVYQIYLSQLTNYHKYKEIKKVIQILIEDYDYFGKDKFIYDVVYMEKNLHLIEDEILEKYHVNLAYLEKRGYNGIKEDVDKLKRLVYFLICDDDELDKIYQGDEFMKRVIKEAREIAGLENLKLYFTEEEVLKYDNEIRYNEGIKVGKELGIVEGKELGIREKAKEIVINLVKLNMPIDFITTATGLSQKEVSKIIDEIK